MARKTIKELELIIEDLEKRLNEQNKINMELHNKISQMESVANDSFENSTEHRRMNNEIEYLKTVIEGNEITIKAKEVTIKKNRDTIQELLKENEGLKNNTNVQKIKNERGAGRKERFTEEEKATVKMLRLQNKSYRAIAIELNCSVATVHKIINEHN